MPTAPKLIACISIGLIALIMAYVYQLDYPNTTFTTDYYKLATVTGMFVGWYSLGQKAYLGGLQSIVAGVRAVVILAVVAAIVFGLVFVWTGMGKHAFNKPMQVPVTWILKSIAYLSSSLRVEIWGPAVLMGAVAGRLTGIANRYWR